MGEASVTLLRGGSARREPVQNITPVVFWGFGRDNMHEPKPSSLQEPSLPCFIPRVPQDPSPSFP